MTRRDLMKIIALCAVTAFAVLGCIAAGIVIDHYSHPLVRTVEVRTIDRQASTSHLGFCLNVLQDNSTGDMQFVNATAPASSGGVVSCPVGTFVSVVPQKAPAP